MWIYTQHGFASIVAPSRGQADAVVRTRNIEDAKELSNLLSRKVKIHKTPERDYGFRFFVTKEELAELLLAIGDQIDYSNFKTRVGERQGSERARTYSHLWSRTLDLDPNFQNWTNWYDDDVEPVAIPDPHESLPMVYDELDEWLPRKQRRKNRKNQRK